MTNPIRSLDSMRIVHRGLDPEQVRNLLISMLAENNELRRRAAIAEDEAQRYKEALREWQAQHSACRQMPVAGRATHPSPYR